MQTVNIPLELAYGIWSYISKRPFEEIANLAVAYQQHIGPQILAIEEAAKAAAESEAKPE